MRHFLVCIIFSFICTSAFSQKTKCNKFIPFYNTLNAKKLAHRLTNNLNDDSAKVHAIHCWMTHHIKYDVKKFMAFDYNRVPVKKILRKRKAICVGYSDLFDELCKHANIISTSVKGYVKNQNVDLHDTFYVEEHAWNAVYINNEWRLIDACWDAGYIKYFKRTLFGHVVFVITFRNLDHKKYKPHFKFYPTDNYLLKKGPEFYFDHLPLDPIWQLTNSIKSVKDFENDSSYYFFRFNDSNSNEYGSLFDPGRMNFYKLSEKEKDIYLGPVSIDFNNKNHHPFAFSRYLIANDVYNEIDKKSLDTSFVLMQCDSVLNLLDTALLHFDSTLFYLVKEKNELEINNRIKNETLRSQNQKLIASTKKTGNHLKKVGNSSKHIKKVLKNVKKDNKNRVKKLNKDKRFGNAKPLKLYDSIDSANSVRKTEALKDSILLIHSIIAKQFALIDSLFRIDTDYLSKYITGSISNYQNTNSLISYRLAYFDDLDYPIRRFKDTLLEHKFENDSLLIDSKNVFIIKSFFNEIKKLKLYYRVLHNHHKSLANEYVKLKKFHMDEDTLSLLYQTNLNEYQNEIAQFNSKIERVNNYIKKLKVQCKWIVKKPNKKERKAYIKEKKVETHMYSVRKKYINKRHNALSGNCRNNIKATNKIKRNTESIRKKMQKDL